MKNLILMFIAATNVYAWATPADEDLNLCARYKIWMGRQQQSVAPFNSFFIKDYIINRAIEDRESMQFNLPEDLTGGKRVTIEMAVVKRINADRWFEGPMGRAECAGPWKKMSCNFTFANFSFVDAELTSYLTGKYGNTPKSEALIKIARCFNGEPIGVAVMAPKDARCFEE